MDNDCWELGKSLEEGLYGYISLYMGKRTLSGIPFSEGEGIFIHVLPATQQFIAGVIQKKPLKISEPVEVYLRIIRTKRESTTYIFYRRV
jgi:hypothetical protein